MANHLSAYLASLKCRRLSGFKGILNAVYKGRVSTIEQFEEFFDILKRSVLDGTLESRILAFVQTPIRREDENKERTAELGGTKGSKKPILTYGLYKGLRLQGYSNEQIMGEYRLEKPKALGAFTGRFSRDHKK